MSQKAPEIQTERPTVRLVTSAWLKQRRQAVAELRARREQDPVADTQLLVPAAQHPLIDGRVPGPEFALRLQAAFAKYRLITAAGGKAEFFIAGNRHHDPRTGQTDKVPLYDAGGLWLVRQGVPPAALHGGDWSKLYGPQYNGAEEMRVTTEGFAANPHYSGISYFCSTGQRERATMYALAYGGPVDIEIPLGLQDASSDIQQFHDSGIQQLVLNGMTRLMDPYGVALGRQTQNRVPADGNIGPEPRLRQAYAMLPWYQDEVAV